jgi:hypothetical protein
MSAANYHANIRSGIRQRLQTLPGLIAVAWEGRTYQPVKGTPFLTEQFRPISSAVRATGVGGTIAHTMTANFTLHYPAGKGTAEIDALAGSLLQHFRPGTSVSYNAASAVVQQAERMALITEPDWINCPVIITLIGHTSN